MANLSQEQKVQKQVGKMATEHQSKLVELYNLYFEKAKEDANTFKSFNDVSKELFKDAEEDELTKILQGVRIDD